MGLRKKQDELQKILDKLGAVEVSGVGALGGLGRGI